MLVVHMFEILIFSKIILWQYGRRWEAAWEFWALCFWPGVQRKRRLWGCTSSVLQVTLSSPSARDPALETETHICVSRCLLGPPSYLVMREIMLPFNIRGDIEDLMKPHQPPPHPALFIYLFIYLFIWLHLASSHGMWYLSSLTRDQTRTSCIRSTES